MRDGVFGRDRLSCPNPRCSRSRECTAGSIVRHGFYTTRWGKRRRYQCRTCGKTFCSTSRTPYYRLQHRRATFDEVATLSVEGMSKSAIARVKRTSLAGKSSRLVPSFQRPKNKRTLGGGVSSKTKSKLLSEARNSQSGSSP